MGTGPHARLRGVALREEVPECPRDAARVPPGVGADRLDRRVEEHVVIRVPPEDLVGQRDHADHLEVAEAAEVRLHVDAATGVGRERQDVALDRVRELPRCGPVRGVDRAADAEERHPRLAPARDGEVVVAHRVVRRPSTEREQRRGERDGGADEDGPRSAACDQGHEHARQDRDLRGRPAQGQQGDTEPDAREPPGRPGAPGADDGAGPPREDEREHGVARHLVEETRVRRGDEEHQRGREGRLPGDRNHGPGPGEQRERVEEREDDLRQPCAADPHRDPGDERRDRRAEDLKRGERGVAVGELEERQPVVPRVASALQGPGERLDAVARERDGDEQDGPAAGHEPLCRTRPHDAGRYPAGRQRVSLRACGGLRRGATSYCSWSPRSPSSPPRPRSRGRAR